MRSTKGFEEERKRGQIGLFPVRLDETVMKTDEAWAAKLRARLIGAFRAGKITMSIGQSFGYPTIPPRSHNGDCANGSWGQRCKSRL
jgi:hypothetical protein